MYPRIICTCGYCLGGVYDLYHKILADRMATVDIAPEFATLVDNGISSGDILDALCITNICCRAMLMTEVTFVEVYGDS
jgi:DNA-directed RNA polymerase subunit N (RpoN/RPB10)